MSDPRAVARAIDALRRGWPVALRDAEDTLALLSIETADDVRLKAFDAAGTADILISAARAATLKLANQIDAAAPEKPVIVSRAPWIDLAGAVALADPALDLATPLKGPYRTLPCRSSDAAGAALELARLAGLLPAFFLADTAPGIEVTITPEDIAAYDDSRALMIAARARLPVEVAEHSEIVAFRSADQAGEHVALIVGTPDGTPPLVRLHSECLTGDVLGSLKCDCGPQLHGALHEISTHWGILLYLRQEGRGIGLINKLRAYSLQDQGFDTVDANLRLGFAIDARDFGVAAQMLRLIGQDRIRLLTNNPDKVERLRAEGIDVVERVPHRMAPNPHNQGYLDTKRDRTGHQL
ncbi:GTP cyclohydrolase II [Sphingomonas sp. LaA6.9]|uniref:GTP cyclohydrolase II n=1 Tax=Sphingomonas sp. LaA6.9 TaxID=2919914 RepID=UPI001F4F5604|nr:GTP cyclohydrolase II [Sphingomonas sp. LaA6.9]MCJ8159610.1 GTP cyclohydrolase II [Sphingomonas sp. LaA6.9]